MDQKAVIKRLCALASEVGDHLNNNYCSDCFCGHNKLMAGHATFRFEKPVMEFIEAAVQEKIARQRLRADPNAQVRLSSCPHINTHHEGSLGEFCNDCGGPVD